MPNIFLGHFQIAAANTAQRLYSVNNALYSNGQYRIYFAPVQTSMFIASSSAMTDLVFMFASQRSCLGIANPYDLWVRAADTTYYGVWLVPVGEDVGQT